jgi:hypothetical protein
MKEKDIRSHVVAIYLDEELGVRKVVEKMQHDHGVKISYTKAHDILQEKGVLRPPRYELGAEPGVPIQATIQRVLADVIREDATRYGKSMSKTLDMFACYGELLRSTLLDGGYVIIGKKDGPPRNITLGPRGQICQGPLDALPFPLPGTEGSE